MSSDTPATQRLEPFLFGAVVKAGRIAIDEEIVDGVLIEVGIAALRDYTGNLCYQDVVVMPKANYEALIAGEHKPGTFDA